MVLGDIASFPTTVWVSGDISAGMIMFTFLQEMDETLFF